MESNKINTKIEIVLKTENMKLIDKMIRKIIDNFDNEEILTVESININRMLININAK